MTGSTEPTPARGGNGRRGRAPYDLDQVLDIAVAAFNDHGYEATSMGVLADRMGTSRAAIYYHVDAKEDLLRLALGRALDGLEAVLDEVPPEGSATDRLRTVVRGAVRVLGERLPSVTLLLRVRGNTAVEREALERRRRFDRRVAELIVEAQREGGIRTDVDGGTLARLLFGLVNSITEWYRPNGPLTLERLADEVLAVAFEGARAQR